jgi:Tfp pilus assembly protein PilF
MPKKTRKEQLEEMLAGDPNDPFLRYGLAMEYVSEGNDEEGAKRLVELTQISTDYIAAYQQAGQAFYRLGKFPEAREIFKSGIAAARKAGDLHAAEEMVVFMAGMG